MQQTVRSKAKTRGKNRGVPWWNKGSCETAIKNIKQALNRYKRHKNRKPYRNQKMQNYIKENNKRKKPRKVLFQH